MKLYVGDIIISNAPGLFNNLRIVVLNDKKFTGYYIEKYFSENALDYLYFIETIKKKKYEVVSV